MNPHRLIMPVVLLGSSVLFACHQEEEPTHAVVPTPVVEPAYRPSAAPDHHGPVADRKPDAFELLRAQNDGRIELVLSRPVIDWESFELVGNLVGDPSRSIETFSSAPSDSACTEGLNAALVKMPGAGGLGLSAVSRDEGVHVTAAWTVRANGATYTTRTGTQRFPGIRIIGELQVRDGTTVLATAPFNAESPASVVTESRSYEDALAGNANSHIGPDLVRLTCELAGLQAFGQLAGIPPAATAPEPKPAVGVEDRIACDASDAAACGRYGDTLLAQDPDGMVHLYFGLGCIGDDAYSCKRAGDVHWDRTSALDYYVRACDLGRADACKLAKKELARPEFLGRKRTAVCGIPLEGDKVFDVTWQDWYDNGPGHAAAWVASKLPAAEISDRLRSFPNETRVLAVDQLPYGITPPSGTVTVWAAYLSDADVGADSCAPCAGEPVIDRSGCVCLPTRSVKTRMPIIK